MNCLQKPWSEWSDLRKLAFSPHFKSSSDPNDENECMYVLSHETALSVSTCQPVYWPVTLFMTN